ncbi:uncharacterized protein LOC5511245 isoform X3 [Nematostella vectensis]|uniref:uncharacterized protein LOC5511245 isoform X3 n=1 Tax=Nematostella vectensis TaxID=45351 RepID=UPI00207771E3|nr:uncharacterized protein LOC5511245 isoform X3 [Nematostella vectensis]
MAYRGREYSEESAANLLRSVREQCKYNSETASVSSMGSSTDDSFVWRGQGHGSIADDDDFTDNESQLSGSALVDSCLKVLQERGLSDSREDQDPLYTRRRRMEHNDITGNTNTMVTPDWERELMDADLTPGSQTVKKVVTRTEVRTLKTVGGQVVQDEYDPGTAHTTIERYTYGSPAVNGDGPRTPTKYTPGRGPGSQSSLDGPRTPNREYATSEAYVRRAPGSQSSEGPRTPSYVPGDEYRSPRRGPGSQSSVEDHRPGRGYGSRGGYASADEGPRTPITNGMSGYMSDSYAHGPRTPPHSVRSEPGYVRSAVATTSHSLPRGPVHAKKGPPPPTLPKRGTATLPRTSSSGRPSTTYNLSIKVGDVKGSGTDGNVYIQLFGEKGNTAKIQLRQAGDQKNRFEKGRTYKFTVDTVDIGKVDRIKLSHDHTGYGSGFFVEEVEVEVPARDDKVKFPCRCWLAQDVDDGKIEREMFAVTQLPNTSYTMSVKLGEVPNPDASLYVQIYGEKGETSKIMLRPVGSSFNKFEKGRTYKFTVETVDIGKIERLRIGHDSHGPNKGIFVEEVEVVPAQGDRATFPCYCWLAEDKDDCKLERDVLPGAPRPPKPNISYHLAIKTADVPNAGTDANVYFQLIGEDGETEKIQLRQGGKAEKRFERGRTDKFIVETLDVGKIKQFRIGHDNKGLASGWRLDQVTLEIPSRSEHMVFPCNRWLDPTEDDHMTERDLVPSVPGTPTSRQPPPTPTRGESKKIIEKTTTTHYETRPAYTPPPKNTTIEETVRYGTTPHSASKNRVVEEEPKYSTTPRTFTTTTEEVRYTTPAKRTIIQEELRYTKPLTTTTPTTPTQAPTTRPEAPPPSIPDTVREQRILIERTHVNVQSAPPPRPPEPSEQDMARTPQYGYEERRTEIHRTVQPTELPEPDLDSRPVVAYQLCLKMGDVLGDGTEGNVYIQLVGDKGMTEQIQLRQHGNAKIKFDKGRTYKFTVETPDIGKVEKVLVSHDSDQTRSGWFLEEVTVDVPSHGEHVVFPCMSWLAPDEGDGKTVRELAAKPSTYHLQIKTGNLKNAGTEANVWAEITGDRGTTGRIQLERSGIMERLFEPDQTDYFTVSASDVGKVEKVTVGHDGTSPSSRWYLEEVVLNNPNRGEHYIFPCRAWLPESGSQAAVVELVHSPESQVVNYSVTLKTGQRRHAGTDSNVYMQIFGDAGDTGVIELKQVCDPAGKLQRGTSFRFNLLTQDVGNLEKVRIGHDGRGLGTGWFLEEVVILVKDERWVFACNRWLADYEDDGKTERDLYAELKTYAHEPDLQDLIEYLQTDDINLVVNSAYYIQHLCYNDEAVKGKIRELGGIPALVHLLNHDHYEVHRAAASCLRNVSFSKERDENKLAIAECDGIETLLRLLQRTPKDESELQARAKQDRYVLQDTASDNLPNVRPTEKEVKELVLGVLWNLSSCEALKYRIIRLCLIIIVTTIIIPYSGWDKNLFQSGKPIPPIKWSTVFRNASGILRNLSSAGLEARREMRACAGLVDCFVWIVHAPIGKSDVDNKSVENSVCVLRNLSYRLEDEIDRELHPDAPLPNEEKKKDKVASEHPPSCFAGCGGMRKGKAPKDKKEPTVKRDPVEGVALLWQPEIVKPYLSIMAEASNPETLEGVAGALHNLMACDWRWAVVIRSAVRKDKGLPILVELLRIDNDPVVRAVATCLRNLAIDPRNKDLIGKYAMRDLVRRLPDPEKESDSERVSETVIGPILCAIHQVVNKSLDNGKQCREHGGFKKIVAISKNKERYSYKILKTANQVLMTLWALTALRNSLKKEEWELTKEVTDEYGPTPLTPRPFDEVSLPRNSQRKKHNLHKPDTVRSDESTIPDPHYIEPPKPTTEYMAEDGYEADDDRNQRRTAEPARHEEIEMRDMGHYADIDHPNTPSADTRNGPPAYEDTRSKPEPQYAQVDRSKKTKKKQLAGSGDASDSWV